MPRDPNGPIPKVSLGAVSAEERARTDTAKKIADTRVPAQQAASVPQAQTAEAGGDDLSDLGIGGDVSSEDNAA